MCTGREFQVYATETEMASEEMLLAIPDGLARRFKICVRRMQVSGEVMSDTSHRYITV